MWVNGASKRMKVKQEKKKKTSSKEQMGDTQRQFFSSERRSKILQVAADAASAHERVAIKSLDVQSLSMPVLTEERKETVNPVPIFFAPKAKVELSGTARDADPSFDRPSFFPKDASKSIVIGNNDENNSVPPRIIMKKEGGSDDCTTTTAHNCNIRFIDNGKDVTHEIVKKR